MKWAVIYLCMKGVLLVPLFTIFYWVLELLQQCVFFAFHFMLNFYLIQIGFKNQTFWVLVSNGSPTTWKWPEPQQIYWKIFFLFSIRKISILPKIYLNFLFKKAVRFIYFFYKIWQFFLSSEKSIENSWNHLHPFQMVHFLPVLTVSSNFRQFLYRRK